MVSIAPANAAAAVVLFQNIPNKNIASTPGEKKPTYSWMNWYAWSNDFKAGVTMAASSMEMITAHRPTLTTFVSDASLLKYFL